MNKPLYDFDTAYEWASQAPTRAKDKKPHLLLGNGFSIAYNPSIFSYNALLQHITNKNSITPTAKALFKKLQTSDFETVINYLSITASTLKIIDAKQYQTLIEALNAEEEALKNSLAEALATLHPDRPMNINDQSYLNVRNFINKHKKIYTANYDLLLYWTLMQDDPNEEFKASDDGFRSPEELEEYVVWNSLNPYDQDLYYLHGALHLFRDISKAELKKLTWKRTKQALIEQIRGELGQNNFPLLITEGSSEEKLSKIQTSDYLSRGLRSLASAGGGAVAYGLSFSANDAHIMKAIQESGIRRLAVSIFGAINDDKNAETKAAIRELAEKRPDHKSLDIAFFDATSVSLW